MLIDQLPPDLSAELGSGVIQGPVKHIDECTHHIWHTHLFSDFASNCGCIWYDEDDCYSIVLFVRNLGKDVEYVFELLCALVESGGSITEFIKEYPRNAYICEFRAPSMDHVRDQVERLSGS